MSKSNPHITFCRDCAYYTATRNGGTKSDRGICCGHLVYETATPDGFCHKAIPKELTQGSGK